VEANKEQKSAANLNDDGNQITKGRCRQPCCSDIAFNHRWRGNLRDTAKEEESSNEKAAAGHKSSVQILHGRVFQFLQ
jgi:hypothetical protein